MIILTNQIFLIDIEIWHLLSDSYSTTAWLFSDDLLCSNKMLFSPKKLKYVSDNNNYKLRADKARKQEDN